MSAVLTYPVITYPSYPAVDHEEKQFPDFVFEGIAGEPMAEISNELAAAMVRQLMEFQKQQVACPPPPLPASETKVFGLPVTIAIPWICVIVVFIMGVVTTFNHGNYQTQTNSDAIKANTDAIKNLNSQYILIQQALEAQRIEMTTLADELKYSQPQK